MIAKVLAVIFAIAAVITTVLALILFNIERQRYDAQICKTVLEQQNVYEHLITVLATKYCSTTQSKKPLIKPVYIVCPLRQHHLSKILV
jgi:hypothetical protein